jgi:hypothetical protein
MHNSENWDELGSWWEEELELEMDGGRWLIRRWLEEEREEEGGVEMGTLSTLASIYTLHD